MYYVLGSIFAAITYTKDISQVAEAKQLNINIMFRIA